MKLPKHSLALAERAVVCSTLFLSSLAAHAAPVAVDDVVPVQPAQSVTAFVLGNDYESDDATFYPVPELVVAPQHGSLSGGFSPSGSFTYTPNPGFSGVDVLGYRVSNGDAESAVATVFLVVGDVRIARPGHSSLGLSVTSSTNRTSAKLQSLSNGPGDVWQLHSAGGVDDFNVFSGHASKALEAWGPNASGNDASLYSFNGRSWQTFALELQQNGSLAVRSHYSQKLLTAEGTSAGANVGMAVDSGSDAQQWVLAGIGQRPPYTVRDDEYVYDHGKGFLQESVIQNDGASGPPELVVPPRHGTLEEWTFSGAIDPRGNFKYRAPASFFGEDSFVYRMGGSGDAPSRLATVNIRVPAHVADDVFATDPGMSVSGDLHANESTPPDADTSIVFTPLNGSVSLDPSSDGRFTYTPDFGFTGVDVFGYKVNGRGGESRVATVLVAVGEIKVASAENRNLNLTLPGVTNRTRLQLSAADGSSTQRWTLLPSRQAGYTRFKTALSGARPSVMETWGPDGQGLWATVYAANDRQWQDFTLSPVGDSSFRIVSRYTGHHLIVNSATAGAPVSAADSVGHRWLLSGAHQPLPPLTRADSFFASVDSVVSGNLGQNDTATGSDIGFYLAVPPQNGELVGVGGMIYGGVTHAGAFDYQPNPGFIGTDRFYYYALSAGGGTPSRLTEVTITVGP